MIHYLRGTLFVLALALTGSFGCKDDDDGDDQGHDESELKGSCAEISEACHEHDEGDGETHACHELAHENDTDACDEEKAACVAACGEHAH